MYTEKPLYPQHAVEVPPVKANVLHISQVLASGLVVFIIVNLILLGLTDKALHARKFMWGVLEQQQEPIDTLIVGDSTGWPGVSVDVADEMLGGGALNLSTTAQWGIVDNFVLAEAYVDEFGPPERIVVVNAPWAYSYTVPASWIARLPQSGFGYTEEFRAEFFSAEEQREMLVSHYIALGNRPRETEEMVNKPGNIPLSPRQILENDLQERLTQTYTDQQVLERAQMNYDQFYAGKTFSISPQADFALLRLLAIATTHDIPLYIVTAPHLDQLTLDNAEFQTYYGDYADWFRGWAAAHANVHFLPIDYYDISLMTDLYHVDAEGRDVFSTTLFERIQAIGE